MHFSAMWLSLAKVERKLSHTTELALNLTSTVYNFSEAAAAMPHDNNIPCSALEKEAFQMDEHDDDDGYEKIHSARGNSSSSSSDSRNSSNNSYNNIDVAASTSEYYMVMMIQEEEEMQQLVYYKPYVLQLEAKRQRER